MANERSNASFILLLLFVLYPFYEIMIAYHQVSETNEQVAKSVLVIKREWQNYLTYADHLAQAQRHRKIAEYIQGAQALQFSNSTQPPWQEQLSLWYQQIYVAIHSPPILEDSTNNIILLQQSLKLAIYQYNNQVKRFEQIRQTGFAGFMNRWILHYPGWKSVDSLV